MEGRLSWIVARPDDLGRPWFLELVPARGMPRISATLDESTYLPNFQSLAFLSGMPIVLVIPTLLSLVGVA